MWYNGTSIKHYNGKKIKTKKIERNMVTSQSGQDLAGFLVGLAAGFKSVAKTKTHPNSPANPAKYPAKNWPDIRPDSLANFPARNFLSSFKCCAHSTFLKVT